MLNEAQVERQVTRLERQMAQQRDRINRSKPVEIDLPSSDANQERGSAKLRLYRGRMYYLAAQSSPAELPQANLVRFVGVEGNKLILDNLTMGGEVPLPVSVLSAELHGKGMVMFPYSRETRRQIDPYGLARYRTVTLSGGVPSQVTK